MCISVYGTNGIVVFMLVLMLLTALVIVVVNVIGGSGDDVGASFVYSIGANGGG